MTVMRKKGLTNLGWGIKTECLSSLPTLEAADTHTGSVLVRPTDIAIKRTVHIGGRV